jgi:hypothetical protein
MDFIKNSKWFGYVGFAVVFLLLLGAALGLVTEQIALLVGGVFGIVGVVGLRAWLETAGWKTYTIAAGGGILTLALFIGKVITVEQVKIIFAFLGTLSGITLTQATTKSGG